ncbi:MULTISPECIES: hypothetical protein [unclassified Butyrivibrio]|uniref:hypothetical protein n=1 Tax=unclassified Butyrivibrio TaxID=2639466 RepID=UPI0004078861|nr:MULTISPECIES: hypothetical protein [unclassified Butyrivibrio]
MELVKGSPNEAEVTKVKKSGKKAKTGNITKKTHINFAEIKQEKSNEWVKYIPKVVLALILVAALVKVGVIDLFAKLNAAQNDVAIKQQEMESLSANLDSKNELSDQFYHLTWTFMTDEENERISRVIACDLVDVIADGKTTVKSFIIQDNVMLININTDTLESVGKIGTVLQEQEYVESVSVVNAQKVEVETALDEETNRTDIIVEAQIKVNLSIKQNTEEES